MLTPGWVVGVPQVVAPEPLLEPLAPPGGAAGVASVAGPAGAAGAVGAAVAVSRAAGARQVARGLEPEVELRAAAPRRDGAAGEGESDEARSAGAGQDFKLARPAGAACHPDG